MMKQKIYFAENTVQLPDYALASKKQNPNRSFEDGIQRRNNVVVVVTYEETNC